MGTDLMELANQLPAELQEQLNQQLENDISRLGAIGGNDVIQVTQDKKFKMPDGSECQDFEAHIVDFAYRNEYYVGRYDPKNIVPPACFAIATSSSGLAPSENSPIKQNENDCATCQQNQFGSSPTGNGKACKNTVIIALVPPDSAESHDIWVLKTSPTAIRPFNTYVAKCSQNKLPVPIVKTRLYFDPDSSYASVRFEAVGVEADNMQAVLGRKEEAQGRLAQEPDVSQFEMP